MEAIYNFFKLLWRSARQYLGLYSFENEESAGFNPTIRPYYERLLTDYKRLCKNASGGPCPEETDVAIKKITDQIEANPEILTRSHLYAMESYLFAMASDDYIEQAYPALQDRYKAAAGSAAFARYKETRTKDIDTMSNKKREDSLFLLTELRRLSIAIPRREALRGWLLVNVLLVSGAVAAGISVYLIYGYWVYFPYLWVVSLLSLFGGVISVFRRLQKTPDEELSIGQWGRVSLILSPITAMGFGVILYYILSGDLVGGQIFPKMSDIGKHGHPPCPAVLKSAPAAVPVSGGGAPSTVGAFTSVEALGRTEANPAPASSDNAKEGMADSCPPCKPGKDQSFGGWSFLDWICSLDMMNFSKLLVWAFIAGFAEQFVPDTLDSLIKRQTPSTGQGVKPSGN